VAIYICSSSGGAHEKWRTGWNSLSLSPKLVEKLVWVIVISLCKIFVPSYTISGKTGLFLPPNRRTLCWLYLILPNWRDLTKSWGMMLMVSTTNQKCWSQLPTRHVCKCFEGHWPPSVPVFHLDFFWVCCFFRVEVCAISLFTHLLLDLKSSVAFLIY
jgi:hypothetical protein